MYTYEEKQIHISNTVKQVPAWIKTDAVCLIYIKEWEWEWEWAIPCSLPPPGCVYCMCGLFIVSKTDFSIYFIWVNRVIMIQRGQRSGSAMRLHPLELPDTSTKLLKDTLSFCSKLYNAMIYHQFICISEVHFSNNVVESRENIKPDLLVAYSTTQDLALYPGSTGGCFGLTWSMSDRLKDDKPTRPLKVQTHDNMSLKFCI